MGRGERKERDIRYLIYTRLSFQTLLFYCAFFPKKNVFFWEGSLVWGFPNPGRMQGRGMGTSRLFFPFYLLFRPCCLFAVCCFLVFSLCLSSLCLYWVEKRGGSRGGEGCVCVRTYTFSQQQQHTGHKKKNHRGFPFFF